MLNNAGKNKVPFFRLRSYYTIRSIIATIFTVFSTLQSYAQYTFTDTLNCLGGTPTFIVDLTASPDSSWVSPPMTRAGDCCGTDNNCVQFAITLSPDAEGIIFTIPGGCGAAPSGALFYQVDCGPLTSVGTPLCLSGSGPFILTFCKPGNNANCYGIQSIPKPAGSGDIITQDGCVDSLAVYGLIESTIVWTSIAPGAPGDYDIYLDCAAGCDTVIVTPQTGYPPTITYQVCGTASGFCSTLPFCDTMNVTIVPTLFVNIGPTDPAICFGSLGITLTGTPSGGSAPYSYLWNTGETTQSIVATTPGDYWVQITDATNCPPSFDDVIVTQFANPISANAGPDINVCQSPVPTVNLNGVVTGTTTGTWSNGTGIFSPTPNSLDAQYTPSMAEIGSGFVELYLTTADTFDCPGDIDTMIITLPAFTTNLDTSLIHVSCFGFADGSIDLILTGGALPATFMWDTGAISEDIFSLPVGSYQVMVTDTNGCVDSLMVAIAQPTQLTIIDTIYSAYPGGTNISCFGFSDGSIDITVSGATPPYSFLWSNGGTTEDLVNVSAGVYSVTVTDNNGCEIIQTYTLTEPTALTESVSAFVYPSGDNISCFGFSDGSVDLIIGGGSPVYTYAWDNGTVTEDLTGIPAGTYNVIATDINGCIINSSITLTEPTALTESVSAFVYPSGDNISCFGFSDGSVDLTIGGGSPGYSFVWDNGSVTEDLTGIPAGTYNVIATDINGCTINSAITLIEPTALTESVSAFVYPSGDNISCFGFSDGSVDLTIGSGSPGYSFVWDNGSVTEDLTGIPAGTYNVIATDINGCTINSAITLIEPTALTESVSAFVYPSGDNISCFGLSDGSVDLTIGGGSPGYSFVWDNGSVTEDLAGIAAGTYNVVATDINGCTINSAITLIEPTALTESVSAFVYPSGDNISCFSFSDGSVDLTIGGGSPGYSFVWDNGSVTEDLTGIPAGTYNVIATDINGCIINSSITLTEPTALTESVSAFVYPSGDNISCFGFSDGSVDLTIGGGSPGYSFVWDNGSVTEDLAAIPAGTYNVVATDINDCTINSAITLVEPTALTESVSAFVYPSGDNISCFGLSDGSVDLTIGGGSPGYSFVWDNGSVTEDLTGIPAGTYNVIATDINGCIINSSITLTEPTALTESVSAFVYPSGDNISCFGFSDGSVDLTIGGGSPGYSFVWDNGSVTEDLTGIPAGTYNVIATDINGCTINSAITLIEPTALTESVSAFVYPSGDNISCFGFSDGSVDLTIGGGSPGYSFVWDNGSVTEDLTGIPAGTYNVIATDINGCTINSAITLIEPTALTESVSAFVYPSGDNISCFGLSDGSVDLTIGGGSPGYSFVWDNGSVTEDLTGIPAGTYNVIATDINGCIINSSITLTEPTALTESVSAFVYPSGDNISCFGLSDGSVDLTIGGGSPGYSFVWDNGSVTEDLTGIPAGTYNVVATDINGCTINSAITLIEPTPLTESISAFVYPSGDNISCFGFSDGSVDLTIGGGSPGYSFVWDNGSVTEDLTGIPAGTYNVIATDINGCTINSSITLTEPTALTESVSAFVYPSGDNISCFGFSDGSVDLTIGGGSPGYSFVWDNGSVTEDLAAIPAGTYNVVATDINGCTINSAITLVEPTALTESISAFVYPSGDNISCFGFSDGSVDLTIGGGSPGYSFVWDNGSVTEDLAGIAAGTYNVVATDINGCTINSAITLIEPTALTESVSAFVYPSGDNISCFGLSDGSVDLTIGGGSPGYSFVWDNGSVTEDLTGIPAGTYNVIATDINGCIINSSITLTEPTALTESVSAFVYPSGDNISCFGLSDGSVDLTIGGGSPGYSFVWDNGSVTEDLAGIAAGTYNVIATDINGCTINSAITLVEPTELTISMTPSAYAGGYQVTGCNLDGTIDLTVNGGSMGYLFDWSNGATTEDLAGLGQGFYDVIVTDINGCTIFDTIFMDASDPLDTSAVVLTYNGGWNVSCFGASDGAIDLTVNGGTAPIDYTWSNGAITQDLTGISSGTYVVTIVDANGCSDVLTFVLTEPQEIMETITAFQYAGGWNVSCFGATDGSVDLTVNGGTAPYNFVWDNGTFLEDLMGVGVGTYAVTYTDQNGCMDSTQITLTEPPMLTADITIFSDYYGMAVSCEGEMDGIVFLTPGGGTPGYSIVWNTSPPQIELSAINLGEGTYVATVTDQNGCVVTDTIVLEANPLPIIDLPPPLNACIGEMVIVNSDSDPSYSCEWTFSTGESLSDCGPSSMLFDHIGCIDAELVITSPEQCQNSITVTDYICINPNPTASFTSEFTKITTLHSDIHFWNNSTGAISYEWDFDDGEFDYDYDTYHFFPTDFGGVYDVSLIATNEFGCTDTAITQITVVEEFIMYVPNAFTPDGNDYNNTFFPVITSGFDPNSYTLLIFDRWGELIFESHNTEVGWNGTYNGTLCQDGVYVWQILITDDFYNLPMQFKGHVTLLK